jgi:hypothetical protein
MIAKKERSHSQGKEYRSPRLKERVTAENLERVGSMLSKRLI